MMYASVIVLIRNTLKIISSVRDFHNVLLLFLFVSLNNASSIIMEALFITPVHFYPNTLIP